MANIGELSVGVKVDDVSLNKATKQVQTSFKKTWDGIEKNFTDKTVKWSKKIWNALSGLWGILATVFSVTAIISFTKSLFTLWSDLEEVWSKFDVVFNNSEEVKQSFNDLANATNRSELDMMTFWAELWDVLKPLWLMQEDVDWLSVWITQLAVDVASFNNVSDAQVINAFRSALTGEREALKSLWIVISEADVKQKAYNLWLTETGAELTKQQKTLATYQLLIENTTDAHGDAIRTWESFANQLKWLRGAIKDVFAKSWKDVAQGTAWLLKTLTIFVSSYGEAIITSIAEIWKVIGWVIKDLVWVFWDLFWIIRTWTTESNDDMASFAFVFQKVVQGFAVGVKLIATIIKSLVDIIAIALWIIIEYFVAGFKSIDDAWNILKISFVGTLKSMVDAVELTAKVIWQVFVGMAEAIIGVFKGIATNVGVAVKKAWNLAIKGLNSVINAVNKLPWVDINKIVWFDDADFKPFELKIGKNIDKLKTEFAKFGEDVKWNYAGIWDSFWKIANNYGDWIDNIVWFSTEAFKKMWGDWSDFWNFVVDGNERIETSLREGAKKAQENAKLYEKWYFSILDLIDKYKWSVDDANDKTGEQWKIAKETIDEIKDLYKDWEKKIEIVNKASKKLSEDTVKYNKEIEDSIRSLWKELSDTTKDYEDAIWKLQSETWVELAERFIDLKEREKELFEEMEDIQSKAFTDEDKRIDQIAKINKQIEVQEKKVLEITNKTKESTKQSLKDKLEDLKITKEKLETTNQDLDEIEKLVELEKERKQILEEQWFIIANTTEAQRKEAERVALLSEAEKIKENAQFEIAEQQRVFDEEKKRIESLQRINKVFLDLKKLDQESLNKLLEDERFKQFTQEEQELVLKLAREKIQLTAQKDAIISQQREIAETTIALSNSATAIQMSNIISLENEYANLISQINTAISRQRSLNALKGWSTWFASGWFTWSWWANEVAWVVHKWEWVAPKWMVNSMKPLFDNLENSRSKWFADGWFTNTTNKTQNNNITVNGWVDLRWFIDYAKWKL